MEDIDQKVEQHEAPQMKVMGHAAGSRTTASGQDPNTTLASRAEQPMGAMENAGGFPSAQDTSHEQQATDNSHLPDLKTVIQRYPLFSLFAGIGLGYFWFSGRSFMYR